MVAKTLSSEALLVFLKATVFSSQLASPTVWASSVASRGFTSTCRANAN